MKERPLNYESGLFYVIIKVWKMSGKSHVFGKEIFYVKKN